MRFRFTWLLALFFVPLSSASAQTRPEIIRGQVKTDSGKVVVAADIIVTMAPNREIFRTTSDSAGRYQLAVEKGTGDYLVYIGAAGRRPFRKRILRSGNDSVFVVDASLTKAVTTVAAVRTTAQRTRPPRGDESPAQVGALSTIFAGVVGALSPDQMGDLNAMAALTPGVATTPDGGVSVFGVDPSGNRLTLNGLSFDGGSLPRDLPIRTRVASTVFDPTIGGFNGALISAEINPGSTLTLSRGHITLDAPQLQAADATARSLGQRYTQASGSYWRAGEVSQDLWTYSAAIQGSRRSSAAPSLVRAGPSAFERLGVSSDSAQRLLGILGNSGIPFRAGDVGSSLTSTSVNLAFRLDRIRSTTSFGFAAPDTRVRVALLGGGRYSRTGPVGSSALASPSRDGRSGSGNVWLQGEVSQYFGKNADYLSETRSAISYRDQRFTPYVTAPGGRVLVTSLLDDGSQSVTSLMFGGSSSATHSSAWRWEGTNEFSFSLARAAAHRMKFFTQAQVDGYRDALSNNLGTFSYNSLADLELNSPVSYTRTLFTPARSGGEASGAFAIADYWTKSPSLAFVFGPRLEWNAFTRAPLGNPEVQRVFGAHTDRSPNTMHVSPRFGFSWLYPGRRALGTIVASSQLASVWPPPKGVLRGGIGEFRAPYGPDLLSNAIVGTGLPGSTTTRLSCVGSAVPTPDWTGYSSNTASVPATCANGLGASSFADAAPSVQLFDPAYRAARRWTGNVNWSSAWRFLIYSIDAAYSLNIDQPGLVDLNYNGKQQFVLSNEGNRPVFVAPASIVASTGLVSPLDARVSNEFGRVISRRSDLRSNVKQGTISVLPTPIQRIAQVFLSASYTYSSSRSLSSGFDETTFGDPRLREWSIGSIPEHQLRVQAGYRFKPLNSTFTTSWVFQSGYAYTPVVAGDVNGDGAANDRAFVFNPAVAAPPVAAGMRDLLSSTSSAARDCLQGQLGAIAERNSCRRPWSATMNARWNFEHRFGGDVYHYVTGSINFANPIAGLDQALHGGNRLRGWGLPAAPDPTLYYVRGFDASTKEFLYEVNPRFGNTRPSLSALYNPFRITIDVSFSLNGNTQHQRVEQLLRPTRSAPGIRPPADTIIRRLRSGPTPASPIFWVLSNADSLLLSRDQLAAVNAGVERQRAYIDSTYKALADDFVNAPKNPDMEVLAKRLRKGEDDVFSGAGKRAADDLRAILTPIQLRLLPAEFARAYNLGPPKP